MHERSGIFRPTQDIKLLTTITSPNSTACINISHPLSHLSIFSCPLPLSLFTHRDAPYLSQSYNPTQSLSLLPRESRGLILRRIPRSPPSGPRRRIRRWEGKNAFSFPCPSAWKEIRCESCAYRGLKSTKLL